MDKAYIALEWLHIFGQFVLKTYFPPEPPTAWITQLAPPVRFVTFEIFSLHFLPLTFDKSNMQEAQMWGFMKCAETLWERFFDGWRPLTEYYL